jgi:ribonuclease HII
LLIPGTRHPTTDEERALRAQGFRCIAGIDEAGRGCWAGPVVAAAVVLSDAALDDAALLHGVNDSKQLRAAQREALLNAILTHALGVGVGVVPAFLIDCFGIVGATRLAMELAVLHLPIRPDALLIDALRLPACPLPQRDLVRGDSLSLSIAAASIIAKTSRDRMMVALDRADPRYGFARHKGYGTTIHAHAIKQHGPSDHHRRSFKPLWQTTGNAKEIDHAT